jgi:hypothetical protein
MDRSTIKKWQAKRICQALYPATNYMMRLRRRMEQRGFPPNDALYLQVCAAHEAVNRLRRPIDGKDSPRRRAGCRK